MKPPPTVFLIDDDASVLRSLQFLIESHGYRVAPYPSAQQFLGHYEENQRGCIVTDVSMPGMNGVELMDAVHRRGWRIPVILISGHQDVVSEVDDDSHALHDVIKKPIDQDKLITRIGRAMSSV